MNIDKTDLLKWLEKEFHVSKAHAEGATDLPTRNFHKGEMTAYQYLKYALDTEEIKVTK